MPTDLNPRQAAFVREYMVDLNGKRAAIRAGYAKGSAEVTASRLLTHAKVAAAVAKATASQEQRTEIKADEVLRELYRIATADISQACNKEGGLLKIHDMPVEVRRAISSMEVEEIWGIDKKDGDRVQVGVLRKVKFWNKVDSLNTLAKHLGLLIEKKKIDGKIEITVRRGADAAASLQREGDD